MISNKVMAQPTPAFTADVLTGCAPLIVKFQDQSTGGPTSWRWDLGNNVISTQQNPTASYFSPGSYTVKLVVENASGKDSIIKTAYIVVNDAPTVNFSASVTTGCFPLKVQFTDLSIPNSGTNTEWTWDFGDGNISSQQSPLHTYVVAGNFGVTLRVKNSKGCFKFLNKPNLITIAGGAMANFSVGSTTGCGAPSTVGFNNLSSGTGVLSYLWNFGDGNTSTQTTPTNQYANAGSYTVTLITSNNVGCKDTLVKTNVINIGTVAASYTSSGICVGSPVTFTNTSTPAPTTVLWDFGDGTTSTQLNPVKVYASPGNYPVKLLSDFGPCKDSITTSINILAKPTALFTQSATGSCQPPLNVNFTNASTAGTTAQWQFGDGGTSTQNSPSHTYTQSGIFNVIMVATNAAGCTDTIRKAGAVSIAPPDISNIAAADPLPYKGCAPYGSSYSASIVSPENIALYEWNFGDATPIQNGTNPFHVYNNTGTYTITLIVTTTSGCKDTFSMPAAVQLSAKPHANFSATPLNACAIDDITFTNLSTGAIDTWQWLFGDGGTSSLQNPIYNYNDTGYFNVTLIVSYNLCKDTLRLPKYIFIKPPIAKFDKLFSCDTPLQRRFIDQSKAALTYLWDFGDGTSSTDSSPVHVYPSNGYYYVKLTVTNGTCVHHALDSIRITSTNPDFNINGTAFCKYADVTFNATNVDPLSISNYLWTFGDGTSSLSTGPTIIHNYSNAGDAIPSLIVTDIYGCMDTIVKPTPIKIYGPTVGFENPPGGTCINGTLNFIDTSHTDGLHPIVQWIWNYGDGTNPDTLSAPPFAHQYNVQGSFAVKLKVWDSFGCYDTLVKPSAVLITKPVADFVTPDTIRCKSSNVSFNNLSQGVNLNYLWDFGDLTSSTTNSPQHPYADTGVYTIKLVITDLFGCTDSITKPQYVHVANAKANYNFLQGGVLGLCYPFVVEVADSSLNAASISWSFGDGSFSNLDTPTHIYNYVGVYPLTLRAYGYGGCVDSITYNVDVRGPTGTFTYGPTKFCQPDSVTFKAQTLNNASFVWDFSDGVILSTGSDSVVHTYHAGGRYIPKMILIDAAGCQVPILGTDTIVVADVETHIIVPQTKYCDSVRLNFFDVTTVKQDVVSGYLWSFGDGGTTTQQNPQHFYSQPGNYVVKLTVTTAKGCHYTDTLAVPINIVQTPIVKMSGDTTGCVNTALNFLGTVVLSDTSAIAWNWTFGNGNTSSLQNPLPQLYLAAGTFPVRLISSNASGCADTVNRTVVIHPLPNTNAGIDTAVCRGQSITLQPSGAATYIWNTDPSLSCTNCTNPVATPDSIRFYGVMGYSAFGCKFYDSLLVNVIQPFKLTISKTDTLCVGESTQLVSTGADKYSWTPTAGLSNASISNPVASPTVTTTYTVNGSDPKNCFNLHDTVRITVYPYPQFNIVQSLIRTNVGNSVPLVTTNSADITKWRWLPNQWLSCNTCSTPTALIKENIKYVAEASNPGGCVTKDEVTIEALCNGMNVFIPNTFSPNGDGNNDYFYPRGKGLFRVKAMRVFNRWGEVVFSRDNFVPNDATLGWDGMYKGTKLSSDVYVYTIEVLCDNNEVLPFKGDITLLR